MKRINIAIIGTGHIAKKMAIAINSLKGSVCPYAIASRNLNKALLFAKEQNFHKAYGSYQELAADPNVDLVYVATPHTMHYENAMLCLKHNKPVLVEKSFTANASQAKSLISLAEEKKVFLTEAMWTRYMPSRQIVSDILEKGMIGELVFLEAEYAAPLTHKQRVCDPALAGGALLDIGIYCLTFASMFFGNDIVDISTTSTKFETGVDATDDIYYTYGNGKKAHLHTSMVNNLFNRGIIHGTNGRIEVDDINNFSSIRVYDTKGNLLYNPKIPPKINGLEYELLACIRALEAGKIECEEMTHRESIQIMEQMDYLRKKWNVVYPFEV